MMQGAAGFSWRPYAVHALMPVGLFDASENSGHSSRSSPSPIEKCR